MYYYDTHRSSRFSASRRLRESVQDVSENAAPRTAPCAALAAYLAES